MIGTMIHKAGAGPEPIPHKQLNATNLAAGIKFAVSPSAKAAAKRMAQQIESEVFNTIFLFDIFSHAIGWSYERR